MVQSYRAMKYDVLSLGQSDLWLGYDELKGIIDTSGVPVVCANLVDIHTRKPIAKPYEIRRYGKMVIGVTGFIGSKITWRSAGLDTTRLTILPYLEVMQSLIPRLDAKTDAIVLLCDLGTKEIDSLLQIVPQIDVVISTGPLVPASQVTRVRGALCVPTGSSGQYGTAITVEFNPAWGDSLGYTFTNVELADEYEAENEVSSLIASWKQSSSAGKGAIKPATPQPISSTPAQGSPIQLEEVAPKPEISLSPTRPEK